MTHPCGTISRMGNPGKVAARERARELRAEAWTLAEIAADVGVSCSTVSLWVRGVEFVPRPTNRGHRSHRPHPAHLARLEETERLDAEGRVRIGVLTERDLLIAGAALYAGEGAKTDDRVVFANTDPRLVAIFMRWMRECFAAEEHRFRLRLYLHLGLDLDRAEAHWRAVTGIGPERVLRPTRPPSRTTAASKHPLGCASVRYESASMHRAVMGVVRALSSPLAFRDSSVGRAADC